jgi:hypothetical protein
MFETLVLFALSGEKESISFYVARDSNYVYSISQLFMVDLSILN